MGRKKKSVADTLARRYAMLYGRPMPKEDQELITAIEMNEPVDVALVKKRNERVLAPRKQKVETEIKQLERKIQELRQEVLTS